MPRKTNKTSKVRCSVCGKATLVRRRVDSNVGPLLGLKNVFVEDMPALVCPNCASVSHIGSVLALVEILVAVKILEQPTLEPAQVRFLRKMLGDTQGEFAQRFHVARITVNRWENGSKPLGTLDSYAIRSHAFFRLRERSKLIEEVAESFTIEHASDSFDETGKLTIPRREVRAALAN